MLFSRYVYNSYSNRMSIHSWRIARFSLETSIPRFPNWKCVKSRGKFNRKVQKKKKDIMGRRQARSQFSVHGRIVSKNIGKKGSFTSSALYFTVLQVTASDTDWTVLWFTFWWHVLQQYSEFEKLWGHSKYWNRVEHIKGSRRDERWPSRCDW